MGEQRHFRWRVRRAEGPRRVYGARPPPPRIAEPAARGHDVRSGHAQIATADRVELPRAPRLRPPAPPDGPADHQARRRPAALAGVRRASTRTAGSSSRPTPTAPRPPTCAATRAPSVLVLSEDWNGAWVQVDGTAEVLDMPAPEAEDGLVEYFRCISGEHPDWEEYRAGDAPPGQVAGPDHDRRLGSRRHRRLPAGPGPGLMSLRARAGRAPRPGWSGCGAPAASRACAPTARSTSTPTTPAPPRCARLVDRIDLARWSAGHPTRTGTSTTSTSCGARATVPEQHLTDDLRRLVGWCWRRLDPGLRRGRGRGPPHVQGGAGEDRAARRRPA